MSDSYYKKPCATTTPAVAIDGQVKIAGRVPSARALKKLFK